VSAAIEVAATEAKFAILTSEEPNSNIRSYTLMTIDDRDGRLIITRVPSPVAPTTTRPPPDEITIECRLDPFGDPVREQRIQDAIARRLIRLRGRDVAPLR